MSTATVPQNAAVSLGQKNLSKKPLSVFKGKRHIFAPVGTASISADDFVVLQVMNRRSEVEMVGSELDGARIFALKAPGTVELVFEDINYSLIPEGQIRVEYVSFETKEACEILNTPFQMGRRYRTNCVVEIASLHDRLRLWIGPLGGEAHKYLIAFAFDPKIKVAPKAEANTEVVEAEPEAVIEA